MDPRFDDIFTKPENAIFQVVFFPDRVYHARYLNATRSARYRYNVTEVRAKAGVLVMKAAVYLDGVLLGNCLRIEYDGLRLNEVARERNRPLMPAILAALNVESDSGKSGWQEVRLHYCHWVKAYQVEIWETLEAPFRVTHDYKILDQMGMGQPITRLRPLAGHLSDLKALRRVSIAFRENDRTYPSGFLTHEPQWDNHYGRNIQAPNSPHPNSPENTVESQLYLLDFQRGWALHESEVPAVRYRNPLMNDDDPERALESVVEMQWILQQELGGSLVFFHRVTVPPGKVEGTHRHIGSEELYYIVGGTGEAFLGEGDDPKLAELPVEEREIFGIGKKRCHVVPVRPGSVIFTKSGGIHGIRNTGDVPLVFVAFLYHSR
jgi:mannose-6-phosphate isomerase-like protein (cupin superfamily)